MGKNKHIRISLLILSVFSNLSVMSQNGIVTGKVTDKESNNIFGATISLINKDSVFISNTASGIDGLFRLKFDKAGSYTIIVESLGYVTKSIIIENIVSSNDIGTIILTPSVINIDEVVVTASQKVIKENKTLIFPTTEQKRNADDGYRLLYNLHLPNPTSTPKSFFSVFLLKNGYDFILLS